MRFTPNMSRKSQCFDTSKCMRKYSKCQTPAVCATWHKLGCFVILQTNIIFGIALRFLSLGFICRENPRRSGILLFADHPRFCRYIEYSPEVCPRFCRLYHSCHRDAMFICDRGTGARQFRGLVMSEIHRRRIRTPTSPTIQI